MPDRTVTVVTRIAAAPEMVFDLELDMAVHSESLPGETYETANGPALGLGDEVTLRARHFGLPFTLTSRVTVLERPQRFVDEQVHGPFASMRHEHRFVALPGGGTEMTDCFTYAAPLGVVGTLVGALVLDRYLRALLSTRAAHIAALAEASPG